MEEIVAVRLGEDSVILLDQRELPDRVCQTECRDHHQVARAIRDMAVRGAPAIGCAAAAGVWLAARKGLSEAGPYFGAWMQAACRELAASRPTAVNLGWAIDRMRPLLDTNDPPERVERRLRQEAEAVLAEDAETARAIARNGSRLVSEGAAILTHCNTGSLAVGGPGTALGVIREAHRQGKGIFVYADETRPRLQGARLTAWELDREGIPFCLIVDSAAAPLIRDGAVDLIVVGADRIAANGDTANKIGTFMLSVLARTYGVPFYVAAPRSTIDPATESGAGIPIEERDPEEITVVGTTRVAPPGVRVYNPAFDVTPAAHITGIITEAGILEPPFAQSIAALGAGEDR